MAQMVDQQTTAFLGQLSLEIDICGAWGKTLDELVMDQLE